MSKRVRSAKVGQTLYTIFAVGSYGMNPPVAMLVKLRVVPDSVYLEPGLITDLINRSEAVAWIQTGYKTALFSRRKAESRRKLAAVQWIADWLATRYGMHRLRTLVERDQLQTHRTALSGDPSALALLDASVASVKSQIDSEVDE